MLAVLVSLPASARSPYCSLGRDNLCFFPELRTCSTSAQWDQGWYDYRDLCTSGVNGGADYICRRGPQMGWNNLCYFPELQRGCSTTAQWDKGWYDYQERCATRLCGNQNNTATATATPEAASVSPSDAQNNPDFNLVKRGWFSNNDSASYQYIGGNTDYSAINLSAMFSTSRQSPGTLSPFGTQYRPNNVNQNTYWPPIVSGLRFNSCQTVYMPETGIIGGSGPSCNATCPYADRNCQRQDRFLAVSHPRRLIGTNQQAMVVYAGSQSLTLQYTLRDGPTGSLAGSGYTVYITGLDVNPNIIAEYQDLNAKGRRPLPALAPNAVLGKARGEVKVAIRDTLQWMDPRIKKDWWQDQWFFTTDNQYSPFTFPCNGN